jgi:hypothetical protein
MAAKPAGHPLRSAPAHSSVALPNSIPSLLRPGALASGALRLVGLSLSPPQERIDAPSGASLLIPIPVFLGGRLASWAELEQLLPPGAVLEGTLTGPGVAALPLRGSVAAGLPVPALATAGDYQITSLRVAKDGAAIVDAPGQSISIRCLGEVLIGSVTSTPMTMEEIRASGIQLGQGDYSATRFTLALSLGSNKVNLTVPVAIPVYNGVGSLQGEPNLGRLELEGAGTAMMPDLQVALGDLAPPGNLTLARPEVAHMARHAFKSLVVIPGSIGYLHQFFKANLVVLNALPKGNPEYSGYRVGNLTGALVISAAESSSLVSRSDLSQVLRGDSGGSVGPGENASGTWIIEGVREGSHLLEFQIQGEFTGGKLAGPVPILGTARTKVLVRNPSFDLLLAHPDVVRQGETYTLEARLTNTSAVLANGVSVSLDQARLGNVRVVGSATQSVETLRPGETASLKFTLRALRNGAVVASYLYSEAGGISFQLATGLGERNVRLNPDTLLLPQTLDKLPLGLREALLRVMGQAWSVATSKGALPPGVSPIRASTVTGNLADALSEAGLFLSMGTGRDRVWAMLWRAFTQNADPGFDQLMRTTEAGSGLRTEMLKAWSDWAGAGGLSGQLGTLASWNLESEMPVLAAVEGSGAGLQAAFLAPDGSASQGDLTGATLGIPWSALAMDGGSFLFQNRFPGGGGQLRFRNAGAANQDLRLALASPLANPALPPTLNAYHLVIPPGGEASLDLGGVRGPPVLLHLPGGGTSSALPESTSDIYAEPFQVIAVHRYDLDMDPKASPFGTQVMVLFNKPNRPVQLPSGDEGFNQGSALAQLEGNALWRKAMPVDPDSGVAAPSPAAVVQALPRVVSFYLERPVGPYLQRHLTLAGSWNSVDGQSLAGGVFPILCSQIPGGALVKGKVRTPTGESLPAKLSYWHLAAKEEGGVDLFSGNSFEEDYWALISNNIDVGADGSFQFDFIPEAAKTARGVFTLEAQTPQGKAFGSATVLGNGQVLELDLVLEGRGDVSGRVVDSLGAPLGEVDAELYVEQSSGGGSLDIVERQSARTGADGRFLFPGVKSGVFSVRFRKGPVGAARAGAVPAEGGRADLGEIKLEAPTGTIRVKVLQPDGSPCPNQKVMLGITSGLLRAGNQVDFTYVEVGAADAQGLVDFTRVPAGDVSVKLPYASGQGPAWYGFLNPGETQNAVLQLLDPKQLARVAIEVRDSKGAPVSGAGLSLRYNGNPQAWSAITDGEGRSVLPGLPGKPFGVIVHHPDWSAEGVTSSTVTPASGESLSLQVTMPPRCFVKGKVVQPDGSPVVGAYVAIPPVYKVPVKNRLVRTNSLGMYRLAGLSPDKGERIACVGQDLDTAVNQAIQGRADSEITMDLQLPFPGRNSLVGHVYQPGNAKLPAVAELEAYGQLPDVATGQEGNPSWGLPTTLLRGVARSAADGSFRIDNLPSGPFLLQSSSTFFPQWSKVEGAFQGPTETLTRDLTLIAKFAGAMEGQVSRPDGQAKAPAGVRVTLQNANIGELTVETSADGRYAFAKVLPAGKHVLRVEDPASGAIAVEHLEMPQETNQIHNVRLWGRGKLTVRVLDSFGRVLPEGVVTLSHSRGDLVMEGDLPPLGQKLQASHSGLLVWEGLLEGQVKIQLRDPNGLQGVASVEIPMGGGDAEATVRLQPVGDIRGLLKRPDGSNVPAGRVDAYLAGRWLGLSNTRQDGVEGRFSFSGLPTGAINLEAWDPDTRQTGRATVQVLAGQTTELVLLTNDLGPVNFHVVKDGLGVDRATLQVRYLAGPALSFGAESTCDAAGQAAFHLPPGDFAAQATDPITLATGSVTFTRTPGQGAMNLDVLLRPTRDLEVRVLAPRGWAGSLAGWKVRSAQGYTSTRVATLDGDGQAVLPAMMAGAYTLALYDASGLFRGGRAITLQDGVGPQGLSLQALARGPFEITLLDGHGIPVTDGRVRGFGPPDNTANLQEVGTDPQGKVRYESLLEGVLEANGWSADGRFHSHGTSSLRSEGELATLILTLEASARFQGVLAYAGGQPVPWTLVNYRASGRYMGGQLATDGDGRFISPALPLGTYLISADDGHARVGARSVVLGTPDELASADFSLGAAGAFQGTVTDPLRTPVPPVTVEIWQQGGFLAKATVDGEGAFRISDLPCAKALDVRVRMDDGFTLAYQGTLTLESDGAVVNRGILLEPRPDLTGRTFSFDGAAHQSMNVRLLDKEGRNLIRRATTSGEHPTFQLDYLPPGDYDLRGYDEVRLLARRAVTVAAGPAVQTADLTALPVRDINIQLKYPDGSALASAGHVRLIPLLNPSDIREGDLDASGSLLIKTLVPGDVHLEVTGVANQPGLHAAVTVVEGTGAQAVDVVALGEGNLRVRFQTDAGRLLIGGTFTVRSASSPVWNAQLQPDGSYLASKVWVGQNLALAAAGFGALRPAPNAQIVNHGSTLDLIWPAPDQGIVTGTVQASDGLPALGVTVTLDVGRTQVTDATGSYRFDGVTAGVGHTLRADGAGASPEWVSTTARLGADSEQKTVDLRLPGTGTVVVATRDRRGDPLPSASITLTTLNRFSPVKTLLSDAAGQVRVEGVMAGAVGVRATLEGRLVQASGNLAAGGTLTLDLKAPDATVVSGAIKRTGTTAQWPAGAAAILNGHTVPLNPDGTLANTLDLPFSETTVTVDTLLPVSQGGRKFLLGTIPMVKNGTTELQLTAPPFGTVALNVLRRDGTAAGAAKLQGDGGLRAVADGTGRWSFLALDPGPRTFFAVAGEEAGQVAGALLEDGQTLEITLQLGDRLDVSGRYTGDPAMAWVLFQDGSRVFGIWDNPEWGRFTIEGTLTELLFKGSAQQVEGAGHGSFTLSFAPDGRTFGGSLSWFNLPWGAVRVPGAAVALEPDTAVQRAGTAKPYRAFVAGIADKAVDWSASSGTVGPDGTFTAPSDPGSVTLTATSHSDPSEKANALVAVRLPITLNPSSLVLEPVQRASVAATLTGVDAQDLLWTASAGSIVVSADHLSVDYTAPDTVGAATLTVASSKEPGVQATVPITIVVGRITLAPDSGQVYAGERFPVVASVSGLSDTILTWSASSGIVSGSGLTIEYTPPGSDGAVTLVAASTSNPAVKGSATFQVLRRGRLELGVTTAAGDRVSNRTVRLSWTGGAQSQALNSTLTLFPNLPVGVPITLKDATADGSDPWTPPIPDQVFTLASGEQKSLNLTVPLGKLTLDFSRAGVPLAGVQVGFMIPGGGSRYIPYGLSLSDANGRFQISDMPLNVPIEGRYFSQGRTLQRAFTLTQGDSALPVVWPQGKLILRFTRGGDPIAGATADFSGAMVGSGPGGSDAAGRLSIEELPLDEPLTFSLHRGPVTQSRAMTLTQAETTLDIEWPPLSSVTVKLQRPSGGALPATGWAWSAGPGGEGAPPATEGPTQSWPDLPQGIEQRVSASFSPMLQGNPAFGCTSWKGDLAFTPLQAVENHSLTLPALASLRFSFKDLDGNALTAPLEAGTLTLAINGGECGGPSIVVTDLSQAAFPEIFPEGRYEFTLTSSMFGILDPVIAVVGPADDGKEILVPVTLPWRRSTCAFKVLAGDHETPVPVARIVATRADGSEFELGRTGSEAPDAGFTASFLGPDQADLSVQARFTPRRQATEVVSPPVQFRTGGTLQATLEIPLTVIRTKLTETDGTGLEGQGLLAKGLSEGGDPEECPTAVVAGVRYGVLLGEPAGTEVGLGLFDPDSGLGQRATATVPVLGSNLTVEKALAPHSWLSGASFTPVGAPAPAAHLLLSASADAPGIVNPAAASWVLVGQQFAPFRTAATLWQAGLAPDWWQNLDPAQVPDLLNPPQPWTRSLPKVRWPLSGELWIGEWTLAAEAILDGQGSVTSVDVWVETGRWGKQFFSASADESKVLTVPESTPLWLLTPLQVLDKDGQPPASAALSNVYLSARPAHAPAGWRMPMPDPLALPADGGPDAQGLWHPLLPVGEDIHLENLPWGCGTGTWWFGSLDFTVADPPPATPPVLKFTDEKPFPPCLPVPPAGVVAKKPRTASSKRPHPILKNSRGRGGIR